MNGSQREGVGNSRSRCKCAGNFRASLRHLSYCLPAVGAISCRAMEQQRVVRMGASSDGRTGHWQRHRDGARGGYQLAGCCYYSYCGRAYASDGN